jgi:hypothetical protein
MVKVVQEKINQGNLIPISFIAFYISLNFILKYLHKSELLFELDKR